MKHEPPVDLHGSVLYHCGPVVMKDGDSWHDHSRRADDEHPRGAVPGRHHQALRRARGDRQGRHGAEDAGGAEGARRGLPERHRRRGAVLRALHRRSDWTSICWSSALPRRCGICASTTSRRSSRWTRTATACTRTSSIRPLRYWSGWRSRCLRNRSWFRTAKTPRAPRNAEDFLFSSPLLASLASWRFIPASEARRGGEAGDAAALGDGAALDLAGCPP